MYSFSRRGFLGAISIAPWAATLSAFRALAAPERGQARITDIRAMVVQGPRTYTLVKVFTDAGLYGIGEGYGSPAVGVKAGVLELRPYFMGKDPLEIEALYNGLGNRVDGSAHMLLRAASAIEIALWDLAGKLLNLPVATLLGGRYRDRVRVYHDEAPANMLDRTSCNDWADKVKNDPPDGRPCEFRRRAWRPNSTTRAIRPTGCSPRASCAKCGRASNIAATLSAGTAT